MPDIADLAVPDLFCRDNVAALGRADALMTQANTKDWQVFGRALHKLDADTSLVWSARSGREDDPVKCSGEGLVDSNVIIADNLCLSANLFEIVHQVPGEAVIIIDDEDLLCIAH